MSRSRELAVALLVAAVLGSALGVVYTRHLSRTLFVELQTLQEMRDNLQIDWGRLQLEQATWATHGRVEEVARERLDMTLPAAESVVIIR